MNEEKKYGEIWLNNHPNAKPLRYEILPNGCYRVVGRSLDNRGRCHLRVNGELKYAHKAVWELFNGEIPKDLIICHKCDFGGCVNIEHMELGTISDNNQQRVERRRHRVQKIEYVEPDLSFTINPNKPHLKLDVKIDRKTGCWNVVNRAPRPDWYYYVKYKSKNIYAHVFMYRRFNGDIPKGHLVRHKCHNRACVAPNHLITGTPADNARDKVEAGRSTRGETNPSAKLTELQALFIRMLSLLIKTKHNMKADLAQGELSEWLEIGYSQINNVLSGKTWKHIANFEQIRSIWRELYEQEYGDKENKNVSTDNKSGAA